MWRGRAEGGLDGNTVLNQHRVQVVVREGEALIALSDVVRDLVEVLTKSLHTPSRGLFHKMDVWEVAQRPLQNKEADAGTEPSSLPHPFCCLSLRAPCPRHPSTVLATPPLPMRKSPSPAPCHQAPGRESRAPRAQCMWSSRPAKCPCMSAE